MYSKALIMILRFRVHPKPLKYISHFLFSKTKLPVDNKIKLTKNKHLITKDISSPPVLGNLTVLHIPLDAIT